MLDKSGCFLFGLHGYLQKPLCKVTNTTLDHCFGKRVKGVGLIVFIGGMFSSRPPKVPFQPLPPAFLPSLLSPPPSLPPSLPTSLPPSPPSSLTPSPSPSYLPLPPLSLPLSLNVLFDCLPQTQGLASPTFVYWRIFTELV